MKNYFYNKLKSICHFCLQCFSITSFDRKQVILKQEVNEILIIKIDASGDFIVWAESARQIYQHYSERKYKIKMLLNPIVIPLAKLLFPQSEFLSFSLRSFKLNYQYRQKIMGHLTSSYYDLVLHPCYSRQWCGDFIVRCVKGKKKIGFLGDDININNLIRKYTNQWYTDLLDGIEPFANELIKNSKFTSYVIKKTIGHKLIDLRSIALTKTKIKRPYVVLFPGASWAPRRWPAENFSIVAQKLALKYDILLCGGPDEIQVANAIEQSCLKMNIFLRNFVGRTTLLELINFLANSSFVLTNETLAFHLSSALRIKTYCLLGGGHFKRFAPYPKSISDDIPAEYIYHKMVCYYCDWKCHYDLGPNQCVPCLSAISPESVLNRLN